MRIACGLDVHKDSVFAGILNENGDKFEYKWCFDTRIREIAPVAPFTQCKGSNHEKYEYLLTSYLASFRWY